MVNYNAVGLNLSGFGDALDAIMERRKKAQEAAEVGAFGDRLLGTIATSGGAGGGAPSRGAELMGLASRQPKVPSFAGGTAKMGAVDPDLVPAVVEEATKRGLNPVDVLTTYSYETGGTLNPWQKGPRTKWGQHAGLIQWGEPQAAEYGVTAQTPVRQQVARSLDYMQDRGVRPGHGLMEIYSSVNAGGVGPKYYGRSDAAAGGAPGTVADKVNQQMAGHRARAEALVQGYKGTAPVTQEAGTQQIATASAVDKDWRTAQATPEEFERQLVTARTGVASPVKRIAPPVGGDTGGPGAVSAPAVNVAGRMPAAVGGGEISSERIQMLRQGLQSANPAVQQMAIQEINRIRAEQAKGADLESVAPGATLYDKRTGRAIYTAPKEGAGEKWQFQQLKDGRVVLFNPSTGETKAPPGQEGPASEPPPNFEMENKLRDDYHRDTKEFGVVQDAYGRVASAVQGRVESPEAISPASDMALTFGFMKMLDPGSVVREGEYATAQNTTGVPDRILNLYNKAVSGEFLSEDQREDMVKAAQRLYETKYGQASKVADRYRKLAGAYKINDPSRVVDLPEKLTVPQVPRRTNPLNAPKLLRGTPQANQYGVVPRARDWTNPDGSAPAIKRGAYTVRQLD